MRRQGYLTRMPVDDFVTGDLPMICARTGAPADGLVEVDSDTRVFQTWWLFLLFAGPIGLLVIIGLRLFSSRPGRVRGALPMTHSALLAQNRRATASNVAWMVPIGLLLLSAVVLVVQPLGALPAAPMRDETLAVGLLVAGLVGVGLAAAVFATLADRTQVEVRLLDSGRWVEVRKVHIDFARAVDARVNARVAAQREQARAARTHDTAAAGAAR